MSSGGVRQDGVRDAVSLRRFKRFGLKTDCCLEEESGSSSAVGVDGSRVLPRARAAIVNRRSMG
jgi:hypothetical protein